MAEAGVVGETKVCWSKLDARRGWGIAWPILGDGCAEFAERGVPNRIGESAFLVASSRIVSIVSSLGWTGMLRGATEGIDETTGRKD